ncbi:Hcp family type VI secretion system effector [Geobacter sp.]|uniref:Hcp family type VI secretion system effector n=1 Tax=Geobacter sp. TaxID=46610 RepID=UPI002619022B|nr:Hcp family type VI secretion system effector [Geobacter sp.]
MAMPAHLTLTGEKQGKIDGSCELQGRENTILVYSMNHDITMPKDPHSGLPTGKRVHGPLSIVKEFDKSSPKMFQALCTGEHLKDVTLKFYRITKQGTEEHYYTIKLEDAIVVSIKPNMPITLLEENAPYRHMEEVAFTYRKIKWTWEPNGIEAEDSWSVPK